MSDLLCPHLTPHELYRSYCLICKVWDKCLVGPKIDEFRSYEVKIEESEKAGSRVGVRLRHSVPPRAHKI